MSRLSLAQFIRQYRQVIDAYVEGLPGQHGQPPANDEARRLWVLNDERLYLIAQAEGVDI